MEPKQLTQDPPPYAFRLRSDGAVFGTFADLHDLRTELRALHLADEDVEVRRWDFMREAGR